jgi:hypothetical protein
MRSGGGGRSVVTTSEGDGVATEYIEPPSDGGAEFSPDSFSGLDGRIDVGGESTAAVSEDAAAALVFLVGG